MFYRGKILGKEFDTYVESGVTAEVDWSIMFGYLKGLTEN